MNYNIDIIDTQNDTWVTKLEKAVGSSIIVDWKGADRKDENFIMGSSLSVTMVGMSIEDGQYSNLFTGDETRFKVRLYDENGKTIMNWFLLPDSYSEPYTNSPILVEFTAVDGLGRLKGKYLPDDYYEGERSVISVIAKCLELTGMGLNFRFAPAIENREQKDYDQIYLLCDLFKDGKKKKDVYSILEDLMKDMVCTVFQADNYWNIEGLNIRNFRVYKTKVYSPEGVLLEEQEVTRLRKDITAIKPTTVTIQPPYGIINVTHKREPLALPETISQEKNDGWVIPDGRENNYIISTDWIGHGDFFAYAVDEGNVFFGGRESSPDAKFISFKNKPYLKKGGKYRLNMLFKIESLFTTEEAKKTAVDGGHWTNPFVITIRHYFKDSFGDEKSKILYTNTWAEYLKVNDIPQVFDIETMEAETKLSFIANYEGLLDIEIWGVHNTDDSGIHRVYIEEMAIEDIGFEEEYVSEIISNEEFTVKKEIELNLADDATGLSNSFRLQKLDVKGEYTEWSDNVMMQFQRDGYWYAILDLTAANAVKDNIDSIFQDGVKLNILEVIYNFKGTQQHVMKLNSPLAYNGTDARSGLEYSTITVRFHDFNTVTENRTYWEQWSDSLYKIERKRYPDVVASIYSKMFDKAITKIDYPVFNNVKINDFLKFNFMGEKDYMITRCRWDIDKGITDITCVQAYYGVESGVNLPPVVEAGPDQFLTVAQTESAVTCEAYDPDGFIVSYEWVELTNNGAGFMQGRSLSDLTITNLTEDFYTFQVTVTDNNGATATDIVNFYRKEEVNVSLELISEEIAPWNKKRKFRLVVSPDISEGASIKISGVLYSRAEGVRIRTNIWLDRNGANASWLNNNTFPYDPNPPAKEEAYNILYERGVEITFEMSSEILDDPAYVDLYFTVDSMEWIDGYGEAIGIPIKEQIIEDITTA